ncbi:hypothetical protein [Parapedobacter tibetensis]|uniref:hypothetical protein n=1 Tax=Parapedobacter tibetensis TaxID=2972951 RepID=UPI00214D2A4D|nr:hypothetical protein [Parapedobacter tibetensis]
MTSQHTIPKTRALPPAMDYELLRSEGLRHIQNLASDVWTDYNSHDPGITLLEALCYAATELGYRSNFDMESLLHEAPDQPFFTARTILTNNPLTINDYRKLLVDIDGVHNVWLVVNGKQEVPLYFDAENKKLQTTPTNKPITINGLYEVVIDLEVDEEYGDLNCGDVEIPNPSFDYSVMENLFEGEFFVKFELPGLSEIGDEISGLTLTIATVTKDSEKPGHYAFALEDDDGNEYTVPFGVTIPKHPAVGIINDDHIWQMLQADGYALQVMDTYLGKIQKADGVMKEAIKILNEHRNLCEDFLSVKLVETAEVALCFDVDVAPDADIERVQAELFYIIEQYFNPPIHFYTLKEMMDKGVPVTEIYDGVALSSGFVETSQLEQTQLRTHIYASDLINLMMDVDGVMAIRNLLMTMYDKEGKPVPGHIGLDWCMAVKAKHKPVLSIQRSKILFFKSGFPFIAQYEEVRDTVLILKAQRDRIKRQHIALDLPIPQGEPRDTWNHWPMQYDLPMVYGVAEAGLPPNADKPRVARQKQLKGYLMFFEQLLADFLAQLTNAKHLFATSDIRQSYFAQYLGDIRDNDGVLRDGLAKAINHAPAELAWQHLYESKALFAERKNRFLDHLLARFAESFNDFALLQYRINYELQTAERIDVDELINAKINTLVNYPEISSNRAKAYNYFPQTDDYQLDVSKLWDTANVSGLQKRICSLTGISDATRRFLYCIRNVEIICEEEIVEGVAHCRHRFSLTSRSGIVFHSQTYASKSEAEAILAIILTAGTDPANYHLEGDKIQLRSQDNAVLIESAADYPTSEDADMAIQSFSTELGHECNDPEGLHLIEHVLLRPRNTDFEFMDMCHADEDCPCEWDTYSFRASVVLPYWPGHFDNMAFRTYMEEKIQEEAPAHIQLKVCWIDNEQMRLFETRYNAWLAELANYYQGRKQDASALQQANDELLELLPHLKSIYPKASLHNCAESDAASNTVMLGRTILGTYSNE